MKRCPIIAVGIVNFALNCDFERNVMLAFGIVVEYSLTSCWRFGHLSEC